MNQPSTKILIKRPTPGLAPLEFDLTLAYRGEQALKELASANSGNAMYLSGIFGLAYSSLGRIYGDLHREVAEATIASRKRRAVIILDMATEIAKSKGLSSARAPTGSEDIREAICYADDEYTAIETYRASLEGLKELVYIKLNSMRLAFDAVKSISRSTVSSASGSVVDLGTNKDSFTRIMEENTTTILKANEYSAPHSKIPFNEIPEIEEVTTKNKINNSTPTVKSGWGKPRH
jgi:hypothetical protein